MMQKCFKLTREQFLDNAHDKAFDKKNGNSFVALMLISFAQLISGALFSGDGEQEVELNQLAEATNDVFQKNELFNWMQKEDPTTILMVTAFVSAVLSKFKKG